MNMVSLKMMLQWVVSGKDSSERPVSGKVSKVRKHGSRWFKRPNGSPDKDESDLLESGEVDALFHALQPRAFIEGDPARSDDCSRIHVQRNMPTTSKTGVFPIMHAVAIRKSLLKEHPWLAQATFDAYSKAKQLTYKKMLAMGWAFTMCYLGMDKSWK